jgi:magnesium-transporting ATPase (P-type)
MPANLAFSILISNLYGQIIKSILLMKESSQSLNWNKLIPWFLTIACTLAIVVLAVFLISNINWFKNQAFANSNFDSANYRIQIYHLHISMIKRSVGLFAGFILMLLGLGVAFYSVKEKSNIKIEGMGIGASLVTASPGLIAMLVGGFLIIATIQSKDTFSLDHLPEKTEIIKPENPYKN